MLEIRLSDWLFQVMGQLSYNKSPGRGIESRLGNVSLGI